VIRHTSLVLRSQTSDDLAGPSWVVLVGPHLLKHSASFANRLITQHWNSSSFYWRRRSLLLHMWLSRTLVLATDFFYLCMLDVRLLLLKPMRVVGVKRSSTYVCMCVCESVSDCVCLSARWTKTVETAITKLATEISLGYPFNIWSKVKVTGSQSAKTYFRRSSGRREFALHSIEWPQSSYYYYWWVPFPWHCRAFVQIQYTTAFPANVSNERIP